MRVEFRRERAAAGPLNLLAAPDHRGVDLETLPAGSESILYGVAEFAGPRSLQESLFLDDSGLLPGVDLALVVGVRGLGSRDRLRSVDAEAVARLESFDLLRD